MWIKLNKQIDGTVKMIKHNKEKKSFLYTINIIKINVFFALLYESKRIII